MRRMREFSKRYFWFGVPAIVAIVAIGTAKFVLGPDTTKENKSSRYADAKAREIEKRRDSQSDDVSDEAPSEHGKVAKAKGHDEDGAGEDEDTAQAVDPTVACGAVEYPGAGTTQVKVTPEQWTKVISQFHQAKRELASWVESNSAAIGKTESEELLHHMKSIRIHRPPQADEPDLDWRGIGVFSRDATDQPLIKIGGGFIKMMEREPQRARFEITRLLAQGWSPCELKREGLKAAPWKPLLDCLSIPSNGDAACPNAEVSDAGWAVSTAVAYSLAAPGCKIPAMTDAKLAGCLARPFPPANGEAVQMHEEASARKKAAETGEGRVPASHDTKSEGHE